MQPQVLVFFHADSNTFSYVVADAASGAAAVIDRRWTTRPRPASSSRTRRKPSSMPSRNTDGSCSGCWKPMRMPITCLLRSG